MSCPEYYTGADGLAYRFPQAKIDACNQGEDYSADPSYGYSSGNSLMNLFGPGSSFPWWILLAGIGAFIVADNMADGD